jgi:2-iminobutanoate/2-iminopropanoate deaminase
VERKLVVSSPLSPPAIGPYSPGIRVGNMIFISGQLPIDMATKKLAGTDIISQTRQTLKNIQNLVEATGASLGHLVKTTVYLKNLEDFKGMNEVFREFFPLDPPARACVEVARLPYNSLVEIEAIAYHERPATGLEAPGF